MRLSLLRPVRAQSCRSLPISASAPIPKPRRRWQRARVDELWQHDSSIHQWWPADDKQTLLLTVDDHSRKLLAVTFVPTDTTWHHFQHFRSTFTVHGLPLARHPRKDLPLIQSHFVPATSLLLNSRRQLGMTQGVG